jgi:hypothetical protein
VATMHFCTFNSEVLAVEVLNCFVATSGLPSWAAASEFHFRSGPCAKHRKLAQSLHAAGYTRLCVAELSATKAQPSQTRIVDSYY